ncbi:ArgS-related anticodon-binding protein NrtL [Streptomyces sp. DT24]|uniref:ArgS-related anticodon-binding protein NrtL n=1 Tax=Streptomyces sp. DT24 TaxID=3416520 RepID=UPI003CEADE20
MTPAELSRTVLRALARAVDEGVLRAPVPARVRVERTRPGGSGDHACAVALQLAGPAGLPARAVAEILRDRIAAAPDIGPVEITGPGYLNFTLGRSGADAVVLAVREARERGTVYGHGDALTGTRVAFAPVEEIRAQVVVQVTERLLRAQGATVGPRTPDGETPHIVPVPPEDHDLFARLGDDAARWALLRPAAHDRPRTEGLLVQRESNPLFRVRYAYARTRALARGARDLGVSGHAVSDLGVSDAGVTGMSCGHPERGDRNVSDVSDGRDDSHGSESADGGREPVSVLAAVLAEHPAVLAAAARHRAPDRLARHLEDVARAFFDLHDLCPPLPVGDEKPSAAHRSRLALADATGTVLAGGLTLLGVSAPEHL